MKIITSIIIIYTSFLIGCTAEDAEKLANINQNKPRIDWTPKAIPSRQIAEKILGEPGHTVESFSYMEGNTKTFTSSFIADSVDKVTGKRGALYFIYEEYESAEACSNSYDSIRKANEKSPGVRPLSGLGDASYFHSDVKNFLFLLSMNGSKMIRMKVNKITSKTNEEVFMTASYAIWK